MSILSGHCGITNPPDSHARCAKPGCPCIHHKMAATEPESTDPVTAARAAVDSLAKDMPRLVETCTDPQALDMAQLFYDVQAARIVLQGLERDLEGQLAKALMADEVQGNGLRVERRRSRDRNQWDHDAWKRDVRSKVLRRHGLAGVQALVTREGEALEAAGVLHELLTAVQDVQGAGQPKVTALRELGLDAMDYCETAPGTAHVAVQRVVDGAGESDG